MTPLSAGAAPGTGAGVTRPFVMGQLARDLGAVVGADNVSSDAAALAEQSADWSWMSQFLRYRDLPLPVADVVARPSSTEHVEGIVRIASEYRLPVVPRGGGSGTQGGTFALYGGIAVDLTRMDRIVEIDERSLTVTVQAGVDGSVLEKELNDRGLTMPHYPGSHFFGATIGGSLAARGSGVVSTKYGKAEQLALQVEAVVPPGRRISTLPVPNHASGPDLMQTLIGSEGTLGIITEATMRLDPLPAGRRFLSFQFGTVAAGLETARLIMTRRIVPAAMRLYDEADSARLTSMLDLDTAGVLLILVLDGHESSMAIEEDRIREVCAVSDGRDLGDGPARTWWDGKYEPFAKHNAPAPPLVFGTTDTCARFSALPGLYEAKKRTIEAGFAEYGAQYTAHFSHWFPWGGMIYDRFYVDNAPDDPDEALALHDRLWNAAVETSLANGGVINEHHGVGLKLGRFMRPQYGAAFDVMLAVKNAWDPDGIMNPGKLGFGAPRSGR
ncbi:MAG: alkyldihydroxyacetonephosphate synthase [Nocardioidaceae bacterium]|nr:alkyldihydroxyacetonephosphate synthase [Nocardioidaceae bacterium]